MDKQDAIKIIRDTFERPFDRRCFTYFVKNLLNNIESEDKHPYSGRYIPDAYKPFISTLKRIGKYKDSDDNKIDILIVHLKKPISLERARTMQRNFIAWYLKGSRGGILKDAALVAYVSPDQEDWRFSLVKMEYKLTQTESGKVKAKEELTPARRYSFLVGKNEPNHTAKQQLVPLLQDDVNNPTLADLEEAFNIEKVTKEFFEKYRNLLFGDKGIKEVLDKIMLKDLAIQKDFNDKGVDTVNFSKKLLGQIIFLYFLQKKGWMGVPSNKSWGEGDKSFLRTLFVRSQKEHKNFFNDYLEILFYNTLNNPRQTEVDPSYSRYFDCKIPFLNGGLFEPMQNYDWRYTDVFLPNELFSNQIKTKEGDTGTGILDVFDRYNFTVKEDEPLEKEVAIDPEMLGKVFENLLEVKDRKSKGSYYTPREIVHYMCQESLINYLDTEINVEQKPLIKEKGIQTKLLGEQEPIQQGLSVKKYSTVVPTENIKELIHYGDFAIEHDTAKEEGTKRDKHKLSESIRENAKLIDDKLENIRICDPAVGSGAFLVGMMSEIVRAKNVLTTYLPDESKKDRKIYNFKHHCIQNCLYGVDIDPGAVEIAKLRLWLSLVVDEEDIRRIRPLPNLDYKIICGNSLLGVDRRNLFVDRLFKQLEEFKGLLFNETDSIKKQGHKNRIDALIKEITNNDEHFDFEVYFSEVFHEKKGFDVVIANPPYGNLLNLQQKKLMKNRYSFSTFSDISSPFIEKSFGLLRNNGNLVFIITYAITFNKDFSKSRELIAGNFKDAYIYTFDRDRCRIFKSMTQSVSILKCFGKNSTIKEGIFTSRIFRDTPEICNIKVCNCNELLLPKYLKYSQRHRLPKIGEDLNRQILLKILEFKDNIKKILVNSGNKIWIRTSGNYWYNAFDKKPYESVKIRSLFVNKDFSNFLIILMNSSLFYFWFRIYGDGRDMNMDILENFPLVPREKVLKYDVLLIKMKVKFMRKLFSVFDEKRNRFITSAIKSDIDLLDFVLLKYLYDFNYQEINHILNYDSEIRGGNQLDRNIVNLMKSILETKDKSKVKEYEYQIDRMVYELYGLTDEEIKIVEWGNKQ